MKNITNKSDRAIKRPNVDQLVNYVVRKEVDIQESIPHMTKGISEEVKKVPPAEKLFEKKHGVSYLNKNIKKCETHVLSESEAEELKEEAEGVSIYDGFEVTKAYQEAAKYTSHQTPG